MLRHKASQERKHKCAICMKLFVTAVDLRQHTLLHTDEKPYKCLTCGENLRYRAQVRAHKKANNEGKPCCEIKSNVNRNSKLKSNIK